MKQLLVRLWRFLKNFYINKILEPICFFLGSFYTRDKLLITPDGISYARTTLIVPAIWLTMDQRYLEALAVLGLSYWGDHLDGSYARRMNMVTVFGGYVDRSLDKVMNVTLMIYLSAKDWPLTSDAYLTVALILMSGIEIGGMILTGVTLFIEKYRKDQYRIGENKAKLSGKIKMAVESILICLIVAYNESVWRVDYVAIVLAMGLFSAMIFAIISLYEHYKAIEPIQKPLH